MAERVRAAGREPASVAGWTIAAVSGLLLVGHLYLKARYGDLRDGLDAVSLGLAIVGLSPWIARVLESAKFGGIEFKFRQELDKQRSDIDTLRFLVASLVSKYEMEHLKKLESKAEFTIDKENFPEDFQREIRHLRDLGLIEHYPGKGVRVMYNEPGRHKNVHDFFYLTDAGKQYLKLRSEMGTRDPRSPG